LWKIASDLKIRDRVVASQQDEEEIAYLLKKLASEGDNGESTIPFRGDDAEQIMDLMCFVCHCSRCAFFLSLLFVAGPWARVLAQQQESDNAE